MLIQTWMFHLPSIPNGKKLLVSILLMLCHASHAAQVNETHAMFLIKASSLEVDEGDVVDFEMNILEYFDSVSLETREFVAHPSNIIWSFGEGHLDSAPGMTNISHRFIKDTGYPITVEAHHQHTTKQLSLKVRNVKPKIYRMWHSTPVFQDKPVKFHVLATDPGLMDKLTFSWDFGDGSTATGENVEHTFSATGNYQVTLKVDDEKAFDIQTMDVNIGWKNSFSVTGGVSLPVMPIDTLVLAASTKNPMASKKSGACQIRLEMGNQAMGASFALTANLDPGFGVREYKIGETTEWGGSHEDDVSSPGTFFAELSLDASMAYRDFSGTKVGGPFWSQDGKVTIHKFDGKQLELSFSADILEMTHVDYNPRQIKVEGHVSTAVETSTDGVFKGIGDFFSAAGEAMRDPDAPSNFQGANFYLCGQEESGTFDIASWNPFNNEIGVVHQNPQIEVTFTEQVDPESVTDNAHLEYLTKKNGYKSMPGGWEVKPDDPKTIRFVPKAYLFPAVVYCIRIDTDDEGIKSSSGNILQGTNSHGFSKALRPACDNSDYSQYGTNTRRAAFSTRVEFASARVDLYQASLVAGDTVLSPGKPTLARVYPYWSERFPFHDSAMVREINAKVSVSGSVTLPYEAREVKIKRPDQYTTLQKRKAENSINFFDWRPAATASETEVFAIIEQLDQSGVSVEPSHTSEPTVVKTWKWPDDFRQLKIQPFLVGFKGSCALNSIFENCDWSEGVSPYWKSSAQTTMAAGMEFTTQSFPFVSVLTPENEGGIRWVPFDPPGEATVCSFKAEYYCYYTGTDFAETNVSIIADLLFEQSTDPDVDIILGFVPPGFFPGTYIGLQSIDSQGRKLIFLQLDKAHGATIAHEIGHFFSLEHCPASENDLSCYLTPVQGFRTNLSGKSGFNKHHLEGNQQAQDLGELMHPAERPVNDQFITVSQYKKLFGGIQKFRDSQAFYPPPEDQTTEPSWLETLFLPTSAYAQGHNNGEQQQLTVSGVARNGKIHINRVRVLPTRQLKGISTSKGPYTLEQKNADGSNVQSYEFDLSKPDSWHGQDIPTYSFRVSVPALADLHSIHITGPNGATAQVQASPNKPTVTASITTHSGSGLKTLHWSATDVDGDTLKATVYLKGNEGNWYVVAADLLRSQLEIPTYNLPAAKSVSARIIVSDGLNSAATELEIGAGAPLSVLVATPENGATEVDVMSEISAWISSPLLNKDSGTGPVALPSGKFTLSDPSGKTVPATVSYLSPERILTLTPDSPLEPSSRYQVSLAGIKDRWNNPLGEAYSWNFETGPEEVDLQAHSEFETFPPDDDASLSGNAATDDDSARKRTTEPATPSDRATPVGSSPGPGNPASSGKCTCSCDQRDFADELCKLFCEEEFAACGNP